MPELKEWTLMFYFASDNPLAISVVSQLKAIKAAGFHHEANVVVQFDPYTEGTPTHIFDVNVINKMKYKNPNIGFGDDTSVQNLIEDKLWRFERGSSGELIRTIIKKVMSDNYQLDYKAPEAPDLNGASLAVGANGGSEAGGLNTSSNGADLNAALADHANGGDANGTSPRRKRRKRQEPNPLKSLQGFLKFCSDEYPARHYMLFILGHGVVVGNDIFLYDEHADENSITLQDMGTTLRKFKEDLDKKNATFELLSFHSCSVSSLEVVYELRETANYMLASQGPTFVGSWPYRQILMRIFKDLKPNPTGKDIKKTIESIFTYCFHNSADFLLAGYSYQLTLCDLRQLSNPDLNQSLQNLTNALFSGLDDPASTFIVLYSHWKAQSFFQEMYTDLCDFCYSIIDRCQRIEAANGRISSPLQAIWDACKDVMKHFDRATEANNNDDKHRFVLASEFAGPAYQYSRGLSVYFPWSRPSADSEIMEQYADYKFHQVFHAEPGEDPPRMSWMDFLDKYFRMTQRVPKGTELLWEISTNESPAKMGLESKLTLEQKLKEDQVSLIYNGEGPLGGSLSKDDPRDRTGGECGCPSFKNYPRDTRAQEIRRRRATQMPVSVSLFGDVVASMT